MANCLKKVRKKRKLTQEELGELMGVTHVTISRWEKYDFKLDLTILRALAGVLNSSVAEIAGESDGEEIKKILPATIGGVIKYFFEKNKKIKEEELSRLALEAIDYIYSKGSVPSKDLVYFNMLSRGKGE